MIILNVLYFAKLMNKHTGKLKYVVPESEDNSDILPNLLNLNTIDDINRAEFEGFFRSESFHLETLTLGTRFDNEYIKHIHRLALYHLYKFAGKYRNVNISKDGFLFPPAQFISQSMDDFQKNFLNKLSDTYNSKTDIIRDIAFVHAEFLFIHPFREGNGRTSRILANMMSYKAGFNRLKFEELVAPDKFSEYVKAVQRAGYKDYEPMIEIIKYIF